MLNITIYIYGCRGQYCCRWCFVGCPVPYDEICVRVSVFWWRFVPVESRGGCSAFYVCASLRPPVVWSATLFQEARGGWLVHHPVKRGSVYHTEYISIVCLVPPQSMVDWERFENRRHEYVPVRPSCGLRFIPRMSARCCHQSTDRSIPKSTGNLKI